ncbi:MAG: TetR/AcrR family transcriptional regulator [Chloroflexota bacterium]
MPRYKQSDREMVLSETRQRLLEAATVEFAREGYEKANVDLISRSAGYAKGTIYNYFESKRALLLALIDEIAQEHYQYIIGQVRSQVGAEQRLERFYEAGFAWVADNAQSGRLMFNTLNGSDISLKQRMFEIYQPMFQLVVQEIIFVGIEQGVFRQVEPASTAGILMTIYLGFGSQVDEHGRPWLPASQVAEFVLRSLCIDK